MELDEQWINSGEALFCHVIHKNWELRKCYSRRESSLFYQISVDRGKSNRRVKYAKRRFRTVNCRCGSNLLETSSHIFLYNLPCDEP